jgi:SNF2 family DNA or RNA helicase
MNSRAQLKPYQLTAVEFMRNTAFCALWLDMGLGKTVSVLTLLVDILSEQEVNKVLIVAPLRVALQTWPTEIGKWQHTRKLSFTVVRATGEESEVADARDVCKSACRRLGLSLRHAARLMGKVQTQAEKDVLLRLLSEKTPIHIINREALPWLVRLFGRKFPYDMIVFDESSGLRDHKSDRVRSMLYVRKFLKRMVQLTGTPAPETYLDLFAPTYLLDGGARFGRAVTPYREQYFTQNPFTRGYTLRPGAKDQIIAKLDGIVLPMKEQDYLPPREVVYVDRFVEMTETEQLRYDRLQTEFILDLTDGLELEADNASVLAQKLLQFASGAVYDTQRRVHHIHNHKIDALKDIIDESQGQPIIVAYWFNHSLPRLKRAFPHGQAMDKRGELQHDWNAGKIPLLFMQPGSGGHGLNLQDGGSIIVWFDTCYPLELYLQMNKRLDRQGQKKAVKIFHLITANTEDQKIVPRLKRKESAQNYLFARLKYLRDKARGQHASR